MNYHFRTLSVLLLYASRVLAMPGTSTPTFNEIETRLTEHGHNPQTNALAQHFVAVARGGRQTQYALPSTTDHTIIAHAAILALKNTGYPMEPSDTTIENTFPSDANRHARLLAQGLGDLCLGWHTLRGLQAISVHTTNTEDDIAFNYTMTLQRASTITQTHSREHLVECIQKYLKAIVKPS